MIRMRAMRAVNWYAFSDTGSLPFGDFTLIAGQNGNGKSVLLDAIRYAAFGDVIFNKSSDSSRSSGRRTIVSYTRGLLDATAGTWMRSASECPTVLSHIVLEFFDDLAMQSFLLGAVITTNAQDGHTTLRYIVKNSRLADHVLTRSSEAGELPLSAEELRSLYQLELFDGNQGVQRFSQMLGLRFSSQQNNIYLRKLRGMMSYKPDARVDAFIRESVLEEKRVDFGKLIEAREGIDKVQANFTMIREELQELETILKKYDELENERTLLLVDDIKNLYRAVIDLTAQRTRLTGDLRAAEAELKNSMEALPAIEKEYEEENRLLGAVESSLEQMSSVQAIREEERRLRRFEEQENILKAEREALTVFEGRVSELMRILTDTGREPEQKETLAALSSVEVASEDKACAVETLRSLTESAVDDCTREQERLRLSLQELDRALAGQRRVLSESESRRPVYDRIPDYVALKQELNQAFQKRGIPAEARFACEYVLSLADEAWRDAVEAYLGPRRYTILVDPKYYDVADEVFNRSQHHYAHIFNTRLLMKREIEVLPDGAVHLLTVKNEVAQKYFDFQLGFLHAVTLEEIPEYENAICKEGRVSRAMDNYFLRFQKLDTYYLGEESFARNIARAKEDIARLEKERLKLLSGLQESETLKRELGGYLRLFVPMNYESPAAHQRVLTERRETEKSLAELKTAQAGNMEYLELHRRKEAIGRKLADHRIRQQTLHRKISDLNIQIERGREVLRTTEESLAEKAASLSAEEEQHFAQATRAKEAYDRFLSNGRTGQGNVAGEATRQRYRERIGQFFRELMVLQGSYQGRHPDIVSEPGKEDRPVYEQRRNRIFIDDLQSVQRELNEKTRRYESLFKTEIVLSILTACRRAKEELSEINRQLVRLGFPTRYEFDVRRLKDHSDQARILDYAEYLEKLKEAGEQDGQRSLFSRVSPEEGEQLERDIEKIINRIISLRSEEMIERYADYRNYMTYEILLTNQTLNRARLSEQTGYNSGAEVQIPYLLILASALLLIYREKSNCARLVFIDEPFAKMDPVNVREMLRFFKEQELQMIFCAPDKTEAIGSACGVILPVIKVRPDLMQAGIVEFHDEPVIN